jgi:tRNA uridine 5-carbamoylmethylation protein Kti12
MTEEFTEEDEKKLEKEFEKYTPDELKDFVAKSVTEEGMLILSRRKDPKQLARQKMIKTLARLRKKAIEEYKRKMRK